MSKDILTSQKTFEDAKKNVKRHSQKSKETFEEAKKNVKRHSQKSKDF